MDLSHAYLCGVYLRDLDFSYAIFTSSNFANAKLYSSNFSGANLWKSNFSGANLIRSHFEGANLWESNFVGASLWESNFVGANLWESNFVGAHLLESHFEGAHLLESHFEGANLRNSHFEGANLLGSHFEGAHLSGSHFAGAGLYESHFEGANLLESNFAGANLYVSHFEGAYDDQYNIDNFINRIQKRTGKKANIGNSMFFAGGITKKYIKDLEKRLENTLPYFTDDDRRKEFKERMEKAIEELKPHQGQDVSCKIPEHLKGSIFLGELTKEKADEIIQRYKDVMKKCYEIKKKI